MPEIKDLKPQLIKGINNNSYTNKPKIENDNYFAKGLEFLITNKKGKFTETTINKKLSNGLFENLNSFNGLFSPKNHLKNFLKICESLTYITKSVSKDSSITIYSSKINDIKYLDLIEQYGLLNLNGLNKLNKLNNYNKIEDLELKVKVLTKTINAAKGEYDEDNTNYTNQIKLTKEAFIDEYLEIKKISNENLRSSTVINDNNIQGTRYYNYIINGKLNLDIPYAGNFIQDLNTMTFKELIDANNFIDWLYNVYKNSLTNESGYLISIESYQKDLEFKNNPLNLEIDPDN